METQILEDQLNAIEYIARAAFDEAPEGTPTKALALRILMTYLMPTEASPSGGMVDTKHSKCFDASRPGSSPGKGTTFEEHPDDLFRWPCGTEATREDIDRGYFDFMSDDFVLVDAANSPSPIAGKVAELELKPVQEGVPPKEIAVIVCGVETGWSTTSTPCGGCGATSERERCVGCFHEFYEE